MLHLFLQTKQLLGRSGTAKITMWTTSKHTWWFSAFVSFKNAEKHKSWCRPWSFFCNRSKKSWLLATLWVQLLISEQAYCAEKSIFEVFLVFLRCSDEKNYFKNSFSCEIYYAWFCNFHPHKKNLFLSDYYKKWKIPVKTCKKIPKKNTFR